MPTFLHAAAALSAAALLAASSSLAHARSYAIAAASVPDMVAAHSAIRIGDVDPARPMHLSVSLPLRNQAALTRLLAQLYDPASPTYRHFLSVAAYTAQFGPTEADYTAAAAFFRAQNLSVHAQAANRFLIQLDGTAADMQRVFHVTLHTYRHPVTGRLFTAPDTEPTLDLAVPVLQVIGLDDAVLPTPRLVFPAATLPGPRATGSGPNGDFIGSDMRAAYYGTGALTGAGQTLGLMELKGYNTASVDTYFAKVHQTRTAKVVTVATDSVPPNCTGTCNDGEQALDIEYAISMAPGLRAVEVYVGTASDVLNSMASRNTSAQLSTSWGWGEHFATDDALFREMAAQGQSMLTASGDYSSLQASGPWPEEDANLTAVGGTDLVTAGPGGAWSSETGWRDSAGGPSVDKTIGIPSYQQAYVTAANHASATLRNVPDIAASSDFNMYFCSNNGCSSAGGTSFASPMWAGFVALANQRAANLGHPAAGFLNPTLYATGMTAKAGKRLHDITVGQSGKFPCTPSYDLVTGLGSLNTGLIWLLAGP